MLASNGLGYISYIVEVLTTHLSAVDGINIALGADLLIPVDKNKNVHNSDRSAENVHNSDLCAQFRSI